MAQAPKPFWLQVLTASTHLGQNLPVTPEMLRVAALLTAAFAGHSASALELTKANWEEATAGKTVLVKFLAPW